MHIPYAFPEQLELLPLLFILYAEIHYKLPGIYSRLKHKAPEVIADMPQRIDPGKALPVLLNIKDANHYPIQVHKVVVWVYATGTKHSLEFNVEKKINLPNWHRIFEVQSSDLHASSISVDVFIHVTCNGKTYVIKNDNYKRTSHAPFQVLLSKYGLPKMPNWFYGEFHCHTNYTNDQVEFGAPLDATRHLAQAMGLSFFCATDHSYDLDDEPDDFLKKDPDLKKWRELWQESLNLNKKHPDFVIVPGEEVSAGNCKGQNVHFLILNNPEFLPGDGDGAERWLRTRPTTSIAEILEKSNSNSGAFAAHPTIRPPLLERLFVRRGQWHTADFLHPGLHGLQIWNGSEQGLAEGKCAWTKLLLSGKKIYIAGGNDAHGNFNRFRQVGFPFLTMRENHNNLFGKVKTAVLLRGDLTLDNLLNAMKRGNMIITNGPFVSIEISNENGEIAASGDSIHGKVFLVKISGMSTPEFGPLQEVNIFRGQPGQAAEEQIGATASFAQQFEHSVAFELDGHSAPCYLRVEAGSAKQEKRFNCFTNPVWLERSDGT